MRYFLRLAYNGSRYHGWQSQPNAISVQQVIENALQTVLRKPTPIVGAGRTDAGVHAAEMYAHFDTETQIEKREAFIRSLNHLLGPDIAIFNLIEVGESAHARFDAIQRTYKYFVSEIKSPFLYPYSFYSARRYDIVEMNECGKILTETSDFTSFSKLHTDTHTNICKVTSAVWQTVDDEISLSSTSLPFKGMVFTISADRFLRNMVRAVVGTLLDVGSGKLTQETFKAIIGKKDRCAAGTSVPAEGLFLWKVEYPFIKLK